MKPLFFGHIFSGPYYYQVKKPGFDSNTDFKVEAKSAIPDHPEPILIIGDGMVPQNIGSIFKPLDKEDKTIVHLVYFFPITGMPHGKHLAPQNVLKNQYIGELRLEENRSGNVDINFLDTDDNSVIGTLTADGSTDYKSPNPFIREIIEDGLTILDRIPRLPTQSGRTIQVTSSKEGGWYHRHIGPLDTNQLPQFVPSSS